MSLKAGRVGVNPADVDPIDGHINPESVDSYTKTQADAKFSTKDELRIAINDIDLLMGSKLTAVYGVMGENGALNILPRQTFEAQNGVTPSTDANGVITATGTASGGNFYKTYAFANFTLKKGTYTFGLIDDNTNLVGDYTIQDSNNQAICQLYLNRPNERTKTFTLENDTVVKQSALYVKSGENASSLKISPYLYMGQVTDKAFYPNCMTNAELTEKALISKGTFSSVDLNDFKESGLYNLNGNITNTPSSVNYGVLEVNNYDSQNAVQKLYPTFSGENIYIRTYKSGTWGSWYMHTGTVV